ncbi:MAG: glycosyltransferase family 2 protein [Rhodospirillaceae bacterium]|nr:glycosyltransferase family 2 protein [Rhodospirillaceae bacterium]
MLSIVVPMYNEAPVIDAFFARVLPILAGLVRDYEILCVNDGSGDGTLEVLLAHHECNPHVKIIDLARNFGKEQALTAGLDAARGDAVIPMDADLQDPPELIATFLAKWREGFDVVYGVRESRDSDSLAKRSTARMFYRLFNRLTEVRIPENTGDFRLMDRRVVAALRRLPERNRFMKGLFSWVGFRQVGVPYRREPRAAGQTKWSYWRLWNFALDGITSFSTVPLRLWSYAGAAVALFAFLYAAFLVVRTIVSGVDVPGYASLMVVILFLGGVQLISLGVIGEYLGRLYREAKGRPTYLVGRTYGLDGDE